MAASDNTKVSPVAETADPPSERADALKSSDVGAVAAVVESIATALRGSDYVVALSHSDYLGRLGGTEKYLRCEQRQLTERGISYLQASVFGQGLQSRPASGRGQLLMVNVNGEPVGVLAAELVADVLGQLGPARSSTCVAVHLHQLLHWSVEAAELIVDAAQPEALRCFVHDYYTVCPQFRLLRNDKTYCGAPDIDSRACRTCSYGRARRAQMAPMRRLLDRSNLEVVSPSETAAEIWRRESPSHADRIRIVPHQHHQLVGPPDDQRARRLSDPAYRPRLAFVGNQHPAKGGMAWRQVVVDPTIAKTYELFALGHCRLCPPYVTHVPVSFLADGHDAMLETLREHQIDLAMLWSIWPETYSYTLHEALAANCFVLTCSLSGNIAAVVQDTGRGRVFDSDPRLIRFLRNDAAVRAAAGACIGNYQQAKLTDNDDVARRIDSGRTGASRAATAEAVAPPDGMAARIQRTAEARRKVAWLASEVQRQQEGLPAGGGRGLASRARRSVPKGLRQWLRRRLARPTRVSILLARSMFTLHRAAKALMGREEL